MTCQTISVNGDIIYRGPVEECLAALRTYALADRVVRASDGVLLATVRAFSPWALHRRWAFESVSLPMGRI